jgi:molybdenum ABC transporter molybdate-binding protein
VNTFRIIFYTITGILSVLYGGCKNSPKQQKDQSPNLIVYCENGILGPIKEISTSFEEKTGLKVGIQNDCARNLTNLIHYRREADIFIPDARTTIDNIMMTSPDIVLDSAFLGFQSLVYLVAKGNPSQFNGDFQSLLDPSLGVILANPETSTLGLLTGQMLKKQSVYTQIMNSVLFLTTDSRGLIRGISSGQASVAISWKSDYLFNSKHMGIDTISVASPYKYHPAMAIILKGAPNKRNAKEFLKVLKSKSGKKILKKYGIDDFQLSHF